MIDLFEGTPQEFVKTFTSDNGKKFAKFKELEKNLGIKNYFAHPYYLWERGANENTNGLIRQYIPKGTDFRNVTKEQIKGVVTRLNNRPKKVLGFKTPAKVFWTEVNSYIWFGLWCYLT